MSTRSCSFLKVLHGRDSAFPRCYLRARPEHNGWLLRGSKESPPVLSVPLPTVSTDVSKQNLLKPDFPFLLQSSTGLLWGNTRLWKAKKNSQKVITQPICIEKKKKKTFKIHTHVSLGPPAFQTLSYRYSPYMISFKLHDSLKIVGYILIWKQKLVKSLSCVQLFRAPWAK